MFVYLEIKKATFFVEGEHFIKKLPNASSLEFNTKGLQDLIYFDKSSFDNQTIEKAFTKLNEVGVIIIEKPYDDLPLWEELKKIKETQVVVDTYFFGFIFIKKTQAREEFFIRL